MTGDNWPELSFSPDEEAVVRAYYSKATVILEYGSGGSTIMGAEQPGKRVFSVESDRSWALRLQQEIERRRLASAATVYHVDIGQTGSWGRPLSATNWTDFYRYPLAIWDEVFFRQPDVVLIDGRFRPACMMSVALRTQKPVTVLFDDYKTRPAYHSVETFVQPSEVTGRMAIFEVKPHRLAPCEVGDFMGQFFRATYDGMIDQSYESERPAKSRQDQTI